MSSAFALDRTVLRRLLARCLAVANGKGGVGKTSVAAHLAAAAARAGRRVLLVDLDPQSNLQDNLGYDNPDHGAGLLHAVMLKIAVKVIRDVRENLDVVPGGVELEKLADHIQSVRMRADGPQASGDALLAIAAVIAPIAEGYDLVVVDCPPANSGVLQDAALAMARYLLIPTKTDLSSRRGIAEMARRFMSIRQSVNPGLTLLGVLLFSMTSSAATVRRAAVAWIQTALAGGAPVFDTTIRQAEKPAYELREAGRLAFELATETRVSKPMVGLAQDYLALSREVFARLTELESSAR